MARIYTCAGEVCAAGDVDAAKSHFGLAPEVKATIYDLTDGLIAVINERLGGGRRG